MAGKRSHCGKVEGCERISPRPPHAEYFPPEGCTIYDVCKNQTCIIASQCPHCQPIQLGKSVAFIHSVIHLNLQRTEEEDPESQSMTGEKYRSYAHVERGG